MKLARGDERRLLELESAIERLRGDADGNILLVEGKKDEAALERLGIGGTVKRLNRGFALQVRLDAVAELAAATDPTRTVILLLDWDRTGGRLMRRAVDALRGVVPIDTEHRRRIAQAAHCTEMEEVPADLDGLRRRVQGPR